MNNSQPTGRKRVATFSFKGIVAGRTVEDARGARSSMENLCKIIIETYKSCMNHDLPQEDKLRELSKITYVEADLRILHLFAQAETKNCPVERVKVKMEELYSQIEKDFHVLVEELCLLRSDSHLYYKVFDGLIGFISNMTEFFKEGVNVEQGRILDMAFEVVTLIRNTRDTTSVDSLIEIGRIATDKCLRLVSATKKLVSAQENNDMLSARIESAHIILMTTLPAFLQKSKEKIELSTEKTQESQYAACTQLTAVLEEIISIIKDAKSEFVSSFDDKIVSEDDTDKRLKNSILRLNEMLAKLHGLQDTDLKDNMTSDIMDLSRNLAKEPTIDDKAELISAVKQGMSPMAKDFFQSQKRLNAIIKPKAKLEKISTESESKDLLQAAKDMLSALKGISDVISEAPELQGH